MEESYMTTAIADEILDKALRQPETDRARIAEALIASLDAQSDREVDRAWQHEINNRLNEIDTGTLKCVPWEEVRDRLYRNADVQR
jgi:putative addiction module component (TIGR02574 family)